MENNTNTEVTNEQVIAFFTKTVWNDGFNYGRKYGYNKGVNAGFLVGALFGIVSAVAVTLAITDTKVKVSIVKDKEDKNDGNL